MLLEAETAGFGASGRNGGFAIASLTHGIAQRARALRRRDGAAGAARAGELRRAARPTSSATGSTATSSDRRADWSSLEPHEDEWLEEEAELRRAHGHEVELLDAAAMRAEVASPTYRGALWDRTGAATLRPGKLAGGLRDGGARAGVRIHEHTRGDARWSAAATSVDGRRRASGRVRARRVLLATSAFPPLLRAMRRYVVAGLRLRAGHRAARPRSMATSAGGAARASATCGNQFHYYRLHAPTTGSCGAATTPSTASAARSGRDLDGDDAHVRPRSRSTSSPPSRSSRALRFTHRWGGAIDTCSRFSVFFGTAHGGRVAYATGYTGLGVGATRFGARVALDLLDGRDTEATRLRYVRRKPVPFPPEPLRTAVIQLTRNRLAAADRAEGRRGLWLRTLDRLGLGFDS